MVQEVRDIYNKIKKQNGERFAKSIRNYDNGIFDIPNIDQIVKYAGKEAEPIMNYLISLKNIQIEEHGVYQTPIELLAQAGYKAYYADTLQKQNYISRYFAPGEELCTFRDRTRYQNYYIINAIKENVDQIKREDFKNPQREDEYGTSVISIQILKNGGFISIKNRYNHTVPNPDNTFNSNPDNIIEGLSESLKHTFNVDFSSQQERLPDNYMIIDNHIIHYNYEIENTYFGEKCYVKDGQVHELNPQTELMLDYFVLNLHDKSIQNPSGTQDGFIEALSNEIKGKKIQIVVNAAKNKCLLADGVQILELNKGKIISLNLPETETLGNDLLYSNLDLESFTAPNLEEIGKAFLFSNTALEKLTLPAVRKIGRDFLYSNQSLERFDAPKVEKIGDTFLYSNRALKRLEIPQARRIDSYFLYDNAVLEHISAPKLKKVGGSFLFWNNKLTNLDLPEINCVGDSFVYQNKVLEMFKAPKLEKIGESFLYVNCALKKINLPKVRQVGHGFLFHNKELEHMSVPKAEEIGDEFLFWNEKLKELDLLETKSLGQLFLYNNRDLEKFNAPNLEQIGDDFLFENQALKELDLPQVVTIGTNFLSHNMKLKKLNMPNIQTFDETFLAKHPRQNKLMEKQSEDGVTIKTLVEHLRSVKSM